MPAPAAGPSEAFTVQNAPTDLAITISDDVDPVMPGSTVNYAVTVNNNGPSWTDDVVVALTVPAAFSSAITTGCVNDPAGVPSCELGELDSGANASITLSATLDGALGSGSVMVEAAVSGDLGDSDSGNNAASESTLVDAVPPTVIAVDADGQAVGECGELRLPFSTLAVTFDETLRDAGGGSAPGDAGNPASYRLFAAGIDRDLSSVDCGVAQGDDLSIPITGVVWDTPSKTATLALGGALPLSSGPYRLLVCADTRDLAGNPLDGDADGSGGDAFLRSYRLELGNVFVNGQLDCDLPPWLAMSESPGTITLASDDVDDALVSGSALFDNSGGSQQPFSLVQCVPVSDDNDYRLSAAVRIDAAAGLPVLLAHSCSYFASSDCTGSTLAGDSGSSLLTGGSSAWVEVSGNVRPAPGAQSALCGVSTQQASGQPFTGLLDKLWLEPVIVLFGDGFESP